MRIACTRIVASVLFIAELARAISNASLTAGSFSCVSARSIIGVREGSASFCIRTAAARRVEVTGEKSSALACAPCNARRSRLFILTVCASAGAVMVSPVAGLNAFPAATEISTMPSEVMSTLPSPRAARTEAAPGLESSPKAVMAPILSLLLSLVRPLNTVRSTKSAATHV